MHAMFEVQIKCTHFLVSDLENRVTLTEVTLDGVSLLLTEFRKEGMQFPFVCFLPILYFTRQSSSNQLIIQSIVAQSLASIDAKMEDMASSIQRLNESTVLTETTGNYIRKYCEHKWNNYYYSLVEANNMNINICTRTTLNPNSARCM